MASGLLAQAPPHHMLIVSSPDSQCTTLTGCMKCHRSCDNLGEMVAQGALVVTFLGHVGWDQNHLIKYIQGWAEVMHFPWGFAG